MEEINLLRHGHKLDTGEERLPIDQSGLTLEQQEVWNEAVNRLGLEKPEITYDTLPKIEKMAQEICDALPNEALVVFSSTNTPRTRLTADFLASSLHRSAVKNKKEIATAFIWEPKDVAKEKDSLTNTPVSLGVETMLKMMSEAKTDGDVNNEEKLSSYMDQSGSTKHEDEDYLVMKAANKDLASPDSAFKKRAQVLKDQINRLSAVFKDQKVPVYFYGVGHHGTVIAMDVAFNGREHYDSVEEIPQPLSLVKVNLKNENQSS